MRPEPTDVQRAIRAQFIAYEQALEDRIEELTQELNEKMTFVLFKYATGQDGAIPKADRPKVQRELEMAMGWYAAELEAIIQEGMEKGANLAAEGARKSRLLLLKQTLEELPKEEQAEILDKWNKLGRKLEG